MGIPGKTTSFMALCGASLLLCMIGSPKITISQFIT